MLPPLKKPALQVHVAEPGACAAELAGHAVHVASLSCVADTVPYELVVQTPVAAVCVPVPPEPAVHELAAAAL